MLLAGVFELARLDEEGPTSRPAVAVGEQDSDARVGLDANVTEQLAGDISGLTRRIEEVRVACNEPVRLVVLLGGVLAGEPPGSR